MAPAPADLHKDGKLVCKILKTDNGWLVAVKSLTDGGLTSYDAGQLIVLAASTYCPELKNKLPN